MALIDIVTIGQATAGLEGLRAVAATMKAVGVNAVTNGVAMGADKIGEDLGLPEGLRLILSKARRLFSIKGCRKVYIN